ncbi:MAG: glycosyltransferase family 4 protein [Lachnospiraceae bacterium]
MKNKVSKLFVINNVGMVGGANKSLRGLIQNLNEKVDLIAPVDHLVSNQKLRKFFGSNINNIYRFYLPCRCSISGYDLGILDWCYIEKLYQKNKKEIYELIRKNGYKHIHLNSYVLYPMLNKNYQMSIHIREMYEGNYVVKKLVKKKLDQAKGIIFIDYATRENWDIDKRKIMVLNNPFNQKIVLDVNLEETKQKYCINNETIFLFVTDQLLPIKGLDFIVNAFIKSGCKDSKLLIAGSVCPSKYKKYKNIKFLGKVIHMEEVYAVADYVLRGEPYFAIGRTVYEGLYSGCGVIIPGNDIKDSNKIFERKKFLNKVIFYKPRDLNELSTLLKEKEYIKKKSVLGLSNEEQYVKKFRHFIEKCSRS